MKSSMYNSFIFCYGKHFMFNSATKAYLIIDDKLKSLFDICKQIMNFDDIKFKHNAFYNSLIKGGFIVEKSIDEYNEIVKKLRKHEKRRHKYQLHINPTINCNFNCWYCVQTHKKSKMNKDVQRNILSLVENIFDETPDLKYFHVNWFGGEPLLLYESSISNLLDSIHNIVRKRNSKTKFITRITTNGFLINNKIISQFKKHNVDNFQITLDGYRERHNKVRYTSSNIGSYDKIVSNIKKLADNEVKVYVRINCSEETIKNLDKIFYDFKNMKPEDKKHLVFLFVKVWQEKKDLSKLLNPIIELFKNNGFKVVNTFFRSDYELCYADMRYNACINYNGDVFKCTSRDFTDQNKEGILNDKGEIVWNSKFEKRFNSRFNNPPCEQCRIFPVCHGGCSQKALESIDKDYCVYEFDEELMDQKIIEHLINYLNDDIVK